MLRWPQWYGALRRGSFQRNLPPGKIQQRAEIISITVGFTTLKANCVDTVALVAAGYAR